jgi:translocator protein
LVATVLAFRRVRPASAALMVPVTLWVTFATALNIALLRLNPGLL